MNYRSIRNAFISGLLLITPLGVTVFVLNFLVTKIGRPTRDLIFPELVTDPKSMTAWDSVQLWTLSLLSTLTVLVLITIFGWFSKLLIGRFVVRQLESLLTHLPFVKTVYNTVKQIVDTFSEQNKAVFQSVVLIEFPRKGTYAVAFYTGDTKGENQSRTPGKVINLFVPTTPNPTSGFLVMARDDEVQHLDMTVAEAMKFIISGGAVAPKWAPPEGGVIAQPEEGSPAGSPWDGAKKDPVASET